MRLFELQFDGTESESVAALKHWVQIDPACYPTAVVEIHNGMQWKKALLVHDLEFYPINRAVFSMMCARKQIPLSQGILRGDGYID